MSGIDLDLARELARGLGVRTQFVDSSFVRLIDDVTADRCDVAMFAIGITAERLEKLRFTRPYLRSDIYAITTLSNRRIKRWEDIDQPGVVAAVARGTYHEVVVGCASCTFRRGRNPRVGGFASPDGHAD